MIIKINLLVSAFHNFKENLKFQKNHIKQLNNKFLMKMLIFLFRLLSINH